MKRTTKAERILRIEQVKDFLLEGASRPEIVEFCLQNWKVSVQTVDLYLRNARDEIQKNAEIKRLLTFQWHIQARLGLYKKCVAASDIREARWILKDMAELQGHYGARERELIEEKRLELLEMEKDGASHFAKYTPLDVAMPLHKTGSRFLITACGSRSGKTFAIAREFLLRIRQDYEMGKPIPVDDTHRIYWCVAPTYELSKKQQKTIVSMVADKAMMHVVKREITIDCWNSKIIFKSSDDPEKLVAEGLNGLWVDEAARVKPDAWPGQLRPRLSSYNAWALLSSTPMGQNWFYDLAKQAPEMGGDNKEYSFHSWPTVENIHIPDVEKEVEKARAELPPQYFKREYEACFDAFVGQVYDFIPEKHVIDVLPDRPIDVYYGFDFGFTNPGALVMIYEYPDKQFVVAKEIRKTEELLDWWGKQASEMVTVNGEGTEGIFHDPSSPSVRKEFDRYGVKTEKAKNAINDGIYCVSRLLRQNRLKFMSSCEGIIKEIIGYRWDPKADEKPIDKDNHSLDALRYALFSVESKRRDKL